MPYPLDHDPALIPFRESCGAPTTLDELAKAFEQRKPAASEPDDMFALLEDCQA